MGKERIIITELPKEGHIRVYKLEDEEVLGTLRVYRDQYIWVRDIFSHRKVGRKTAINHFKNYKDELT